MSKICARFPLLGGALLLLCAAGLQAQSLPTRHVRGEVASGEASFTGLLPADQAMRLDLMLPLRNEAELDQLLQNLYDPQSPLFHKFLSVEEFTARFGPSAEDYAA